MYEIENKKLMAKKKIENTKKKNLSLSVSLSQTQSLRLLESTLLFGIQLIVKGKPCILFNLL